MKIGKKTIPIEGRTDKICFNITLFGWLVSQPDTKSAPATSHPVVLCNRLNQARKKLFCCTLQISITTLFISPLPHYPFSNYLHQLSGLSPKQPRNIDISIKHTKQQKMAGSYVLCCFSFILLIVYQQSYLYMEVSQVFFPSAQFCNTWLDMHATAIVISLNSTTNSTVTLCIVKH